MKKDYPERKERDLTETKKEEIRKYIDRGDSNIYELGEKFGCSSSQIAGIKAAMRRGLVRRKTHSH